MINQAGLNEYEKRQWDRFVLDNSGSFLQSFAWGEFQEKFGRRVWRLADPEAGWLAQFVEFNLPFGKKYWYCPRGPITKKPGQGQQFSKFIEAVKNTAWKEKIMFFRIGPEWPLGGELAAKLEINGFKKLRYDIEPAQTLILDISKTEEELSSQMHHKWRYNVSLAQKKEVGVDVLDCDDTDFEEYFERFFRLIELTSQRQGIKPHPKEYHKKQLQIKDDNLRTFLFVAEHQGLAVAANIIALFGRRAIYLHGASDNEQRSLMAPHLLQWEQIKEAKKMGCTEYDFWGINEQKWPGVTRFKRGFGGQEVKYIGTWDYPIDKSWYALYRSIQKFRR